MASISNIIEQRPRIITWIAVLMGFTMMRAFMGIQLPTLEMFGGENPDAWFAPWISDAILGLLAPFMIYLLLKRRGIMIWAGLLIYNAIGAFDYTHGLMVQWTDPLVPNGIMGNAALTYGSVGFSFLVQLGVLYLLFKDEVMDYFVGRGDRVEES